MSMSREIVKLIQHSELKTTTFDRPLPIPANQTFHLALATNPERENNFNFIGKIMPTKVTKKSASYAVIMIGSNGKGLFVSEYQWEWQRGGIMQFYEVDADGNFNELTEGPLHILQVGAVIGVHSSKCRISEPEWWTHFYELGGTITSQDRMDRLDAFETLQIINEHGGATIN